MGQFRRVAKDLKNTWPDMLRVWDTAMDEEYLQHVGHNFFSDLDSLEVCLLTEVTMRLISELSDRSRCYAWPMRLLLPF